jgi:hypothetical protein
MADLINNTIGENYNHFVNGMDLDTSDIFLSKDTYRYSENIRIVCDQDSTSGLIQNVSDKQVLSGSYINCTNLADRTINGFTPTWTTTTLSQLTLPTDFGVITGIKDIRNYTVIFTFKAASTTNITNGLLRIYKLYTDNDIYCLKEIANTTVYLNDAYENINNFSIVARYEDSDNIKIYWADGYNLTRVINIADKYDNDNISVTNIDTFGIDPVVSFKSPTFIGVGSGSLKSGKIQYCYQLFDVNGSETEMSPSTNMISLFKYNSGTLSTSTVGNYVNETSGRSIKLKISLDSTNFDRIKVYSIYYASETTLPVITNILDQAITNELTIYVEDTGDISLSTLTIDEFNIIKGVYIIPRVLESKYNYLFAGNIKYNDLSIDYDARSYRFASIYDTSSKNLYFYLKLISSNTSDTINKIFSYDDLYGNTSVLDTYLSTIPVDHDCINDYNYATKDSFEFSESVSFDSTNVDYARLSTNSLKFNKGLLKGNSQYANEPHLISGGRGLNVDYEFITSKISLDDTVITTPTTDNPHANVNFTYGDSSQDISLTNVTRKDITGFHQQVIGKKYINNTLTDYINSTFYTIDSTVDFTDYGGIIVDYYMKSLQRDEIYRYGCRLYDKFGRKSDVKWIGDIRTPGSDELGYEPYINETTISFKSDNTDAKYVKLVAKPLGIRFSFRDLPDDVKAIEIVRVERTLSNSTILSQGVIYKEYELGENDDILVGYSSPIAWASEYDGMCAYSSGSDVGDLFIRADDGDNTYMPTKGGPIRNFSAYPTILKFINPEITYVSDFADTIKNTSLRISSPYVLFGKEPLRDSDNVSANIIWPMGFNIDNDKTQETGYLSYKGQFTTSNAGHGINNRTGLLAVNYSSQGPWNNVPSYGDMTFEFEGLRSYETGSLYNRGTIIKLYNQGVSGLIQNTLTQNNSLDVSRNINTDNIKTKLNVNGVTKSKDLEWNNTFDYFNTTTTLENKSITNVNTFNFISNNYFYTYKNLVMHMDYKGTDHVTWGFHIGGWHICPEDTVLYLNTDNYTNVLGAFHKLNGIKQNASTIGTSVNTSILNLIPYDDGVNGLNTADYDLTPTITYLVNLKQNKNPYGGYTYQARQLSEYESVGYVNNNSTSVSIDLYTGDTYIGVFNHTYNRRFFHPTETGLTDPFSRICMGYLRGYINLMIPVESRINLSLTQGLEYTRNHNLDTQMAISSIPELLEQTKPKAIYNPTYSREPIATIGTAKNIYDVYNRHIDTRIHYTTSKTNDEIIDSWSKFSSLNYLDVDSRYGEITNLKLFKNQLLSFQLNGTSLLSVKERSLITDGNNAKLVLGSGDVLDRFDYISTFYGMANNHINAIEFNDNALMFYDGTRNELVSYSSDILPLSKTKKVQSYLNKNKSEVLTNPSIVYDKKFNEFIFNIASDKSLVYNSLLNCFTSFFTINSDNLTYNASNIITLNNGLIYSYTNDSPSNNLMAKLNLIVNDIPTDTKVFDNVEFISNTNTTPMRVQFITDQQNSNITTLADMRCKESTYYFAIPRVAMYSDFPDRMRGNTIQCNYVFDKSINQFHIPYIKTKYRISRS